MFAAMEGIIETFVAEALGANHPLDRYGADGGVLDVVEAGFHGDVWGIMGF